MGTWVRHPNGGRVATVAVGVDEVEWIMEAGRMGITGCGATVKARWGLRGPEEFLDVVFDNPYPYPHP